MQYTQLSRRSAGGNKIDWEKQYLTFIPVEDAVFTWAERAVSGHLEYSVNGGQTWVTIANGESTPTITAGSKVMWRGDLVPSTVLGSRGIGIFSASGLYDAMGNTMSLLYGDNYIGQTTLVGTYTFCNLWQEDTHIYRADRIVLPAMSLRKSCYDFMFDKCTNLVTAPALPATTLADYCYDRMFRNCTSLIIAPELPATTLIPYCYYEMFQGCTSLTTAPELPATTLVDGCYYQMFYKCTSITTAPELPATTLRHTCYTGMFYGCRSLNYVKCLATDISATNCTSNWLSGVASTGTFVKDATMTDWTTGVNGIPSGWTVVDDNS